MEPLRASRARSCQYRTGPAEAGRQAVTSHLGIGTLRPTRVRPRVPGAPHAKDATQIQPGYGSVPAGQAPAPRQSARMEMSR